MAMLLMLNALQGALVVVLSPSFRSFTRTSKQLAQQACGLFDGGHLA